MDLQDRRQSFSMVVLAGGKSTRMGRDKADLMIGKETFLEHQIRKGKLLGLKEILVSGYRGEHCSVPVIPDDRRERGPLGGLESCLSRISGSHCLVIGVDVPLVPSAELEAMMRMSEKHPEKAIILIHGKRRENLVGIYPVTYLPFICYELEYGKGAVFRLLEDRGYEAYESQVSDSFFRNFNYEEDYLALCEEIENGTYTF